MYLVISEGQWTEHIVARCKDMCSAEYFLERQKEENNWLHLYIVKVEKVIHYGD